MLKPVVGTRHRGAYVMAGTRELLTGATLTRDELFERVRTERGRLSHVPLLAEELVTNERGEHALAVDYKLHVFGDTIGAIQVIHRSPGPDTPAVQRFYTPDWRPFEDPMSTRLPTGPASAPPACLAQLCEAARTLGSFFATYVRVDLYASRAGCVFGEFSFTPSGGGHFTPFADACFEALWSEHFPDAL